MSLPSTPADPRSPGQHAADAARIAALAGRVAGEHGAHTVILYGSWARGDATGESDVDLLLVRAHGPAARDARVLDGLYLDAFVYPESAVATPEPSLLRILGGRVLRESNGSGEALLRRVAELDRRGPAALPPDERAALLVWARKTLGRCRAHPGPEADYRRAHLLTQALEDYFSLRTLWFRGSKEAFAWLGRHDPRALAAFEAAMRRGAADDDLAALVEVVYPRPDSTGGDLEEAG